MVPEVTDDKCKDVTHAALTNVTPDVTELIIDTLHMTLHMTFLMTLHMTLLMTFQGGGPGLLPGRQWWAAHG